MTLNQIIMYCMAFGVVLGGLDRILGNHFGFGDKFENGFRLLGPVALSMAGIICLTPLLAAVLRNAVAPLCGPLGLDPALFGGLLAIDMGGYQLAGELAEDPGLGRFSGIIVSAVFGCTVVFTIPVGLGAIGAEDRPHFIRGILLGLLAVPVSLTAGGLVMGLAAGKLLWNMAPIVALTGLLFFGMLKKPDRMERIFRGFAGLVQAAATLGLIHGAVEYLTGFSLIPGMPPLMEAMETVCAIGTVMLGGLPLAELFRRLMQRPLARLQKRTGLNSVSAAALLMGLVSVTPALVMIPEMDRRGKVVCSAAMVCGASAFAAHLAFAMSTEPELVSALLAAKLLGAGMAAAIALAATRDFKTE